MPAATSPYEDWTKADLIAKLMELESKRETTQSAAREKIDFACHARRKIALRFCYAGWAYNGLAVQAQPTPLPTVEGVLFAALAKARLVDPDAGMDGCGWERCGRTDRGVSAAGQVVSLWVRSALRPEEDASRTGETLGSTRAEDAEAGEEAWGEGDDDFFGAFDETDFAGPSRSSSAQEQEFHYAVVLNRILPPTIRIIAWSPVSPDFSSRFSCQSRHYKYFFSADELDVGRMADAASLLVGEHDFRNFCKFDPAKQLTVYTRRVQSATISAVRDSDSDGMYVFDLVGNAFLYHQVRHIMAILFLVGSGLEPPSVVSALLNVAPGAEGDADASLPVVDTKPEYQMADGLPLVLYACHYPAGALEWRSDAETTTSSEGLYRQMHTALGRSEMFATLNRVFLAAAAVYHPKPPSTLPIHETGFAVDGKTAMNVPLGGSEVRWVAKYVPVLERKRGDHFEVVNERWRLGKGARRDERKKAGTEEAPVCPA
ncbi:unnamed protein product [Mycena citricolor]|uniref:Pseudouridine synthase I TruA alpha/beta domain-containing protein n=1 Tax=Mycena citricolor TaxID=2018698 RepID=A0AAD2K099_9AGAR|nr:unnamed protein product [Mycena citricolor]